MEFIDRFILLMFRFFVIERTWEFWLQLKSNVTEFSLIWRPIPLTI
jgi:hypothetical protein